MNNAAFEVNDVTSLYFCEDNIRVFVLGPNPERATVCVSKLNNTGVLGDIDLIKFPLRSIALILVY